MTIQDQQRLYLQVIFDYFQEKAEWPTYRYVDRKLFNDTGIDAKEVSMSLPNGFANGFHFDNDLSNQAVLSLEAIRMCNGSEGDLADFLTAVRFLIDVYRQSEEDNPLVTSADFKNHLPLTDEAIARVGKLIAGEGILWRSSSMPVDGSGIWQFNVDREVRRFAGVTSLEDYLERRKRERITARQQATQQVPSLLGHMYRQPNTEETTAGLQTWVGNLTQPNPQTGAKLEVALLNALARLGVPTLFGGDIQCGGPATPTYDLVALDFGAPMQSPTAVLISCKSTTNQPGRTDIALLSDASTRIQAILPDWRVFGALVNLGQPTADEFAYRQDVRIWKQSHLQALLYAKEYRFIAQFLWTPPWHWNAEREVMWWNTYRAYHQEMFSQE
jgi:hypothetical protein